MKPLKTIAIIGGGFCAACIAISLARTSQPYRLIIIDSYGRFGKGIAYSTGESMHLLNVPVKNMGVESGNPGGFYQWLQGRGDFLDLNAFSFMPRYLYGIYLQEACQAAQNKAQEGGAKWEWVRGTVVDIEVRGKSFYIHLQSGQVLLSDIAVLATGVPSYSIPTVLKGVDTRYWTPDVWNPLPSSPLYAEDLAHCKEPYLILGTGLTMADIALSIYKRGYSASLFALSNSGSLPLRHLPCPGPSQPLSCLSHEKSIAALWHAVRLEALRAEKAGRDWRGIVDAVRLQIPALWSCLDHVEQRRFLRHGLRLWNKVRHRLPPPVGAMLAEKQLSRQLLFRCGRLLKVEEKGNGVIAHYGVGDSMQILQVAHIFNCCGPAFKMHQKAPALLHNLHKRHLVEWHPNGYGIKVDEATLRTAKADVTAPLYAVGALLFGQYLESTAVPELRDQCQKICQSLEVQLFS